MSQYLLTIYLVGTTYSRCKVQGHMTHGSYLEFRTFGGGSGILHRTLGELEYSKCLGFLINGI